MCFAGTVLRREACLRLGPLKRVRSPGPALPSDRRVSAIATREPANMHPLGAVDGVSNSRSPREWDACATPDHPRVQHRRYGPCDQVAFPIKGDNAGDPVPPPAAASRQPDPAGRPGLPAGPGMAWAASHRTARRASQSVSIWFPAVWRGSARQTRTTTRPTRTPTGHACKAGGRRAAALLN